jgi:hypothetical protein
VFNEDGARLQRVKIAVDIGNLFYRLFKAGHRAAGNTEDLKEFNLQSLLLRALLFAPVQSRENLITLCRISFQEIGMARSVANQTGTEQVA